MRFASAIGAPLATSIFASKLRLWPIILQRHSGASAGLPRGTRRKSMTSTTVLPSISAAI